MDRGHDFFLSLFVAHMIYPHLLPTLGWLLPILFIAAWFKSASFKAFIGEIIVNLAATYCLSEDDYHRISNISITSEDDLIQIDQIIVSRYGIFVVEINKVQGWIFGNAHQQTWTQQTEKNTQQFPNPLQHNYKQCKALESALALDPGKLFSVIVFVGDSKFKTEMPENITDERGYMLYIKSKGTILLTETAVKQVIRQLADGGLKSSIKSQRKSVRELMVTKQERPESAPVKACPKCGRKMILHTAEKASEAGHQFWGCSDFSKCGSVAAVNEASLI